ncbi:uncharacterized protein LOC117830889 isoform X2 [Notolabrus celidotus]|uniref:uncharacterized protein LOC117830889 isoform X2 n=1 Tax=Notolabrus celidotus TaxID=1203425 RepID=UPI00148FE91E|nr:uncharacterized protein LOC117830889 isoform X2 [Notolabrus celidotus]
MRPGGRSGRSRGGSATPLFVQEKQVSDEEESGACGVVESTEGEGKEPSLSDLMSILRANRGQQEAREARQNEVTAKQDQHLKALQHQFQLLQLEIQARTTPTPEPQFSDFDQLNVEAPTLNVQYPQSQTGSSTMTLHPTVTAGQFHSQHVPRLEKLSDDDDIEHFLITFERIAVACRWQKSDWIFHLIPLLTGKARGAYVHMDIDDSLDYDLVKSAVFAKYDINPETYRQKFRSLEVDLEESPKELYARLKELYGKWIQPKGKTIQEIGEIIILEQYLRMLSPELQVWIREHNPVSALEAAKLADVFVAARKKGQPWSYNTWETRDNRKPVQHSQQEATSLGKPPMAENQPPGRLSKYPSKRPVCYLCGLEGHTKPMCPKNSVKMTQMCFVPRPHAEPEFKHDQSIKMTNIEVNGITLRALLDSGSDQTLVHRKFVPPNIISTMETIPICCVHGDEKSYVTADMYIKVSGQTYLLNIGVADNLPFDAVLGRDLPVLFDLLEPEQSRCCSAAVTRLQAKKCDETSESLSALPFFGEELEATPGKSRKTRSLRRQEKFQQTVVTSPGNTELELPLEFQVLTNITDMQKTDPSLVSFFQKAKEKEQGAEKDSDRDEYILRNGILYRQQESLLQLVVPQAARDTILGLGHSVPWAGHLGKHKTTARIKHHFHWPGLRRDVAQFCKSCPQCQITSAKIPSRAPLQPLPIIGTPFERLGMDIVGPVERSKAGNRYMLVITDYATKYPEVFPLKSIKAKSVAFCLVQFFSRVGFPCEILTDQGTNFMSTLLKQVYQLLGIRSLRTTPYHPQTDGLTERFNQTLKQMLRKFVNNSGTDWDQWLPYLLFAYREVPQASTGFSPFELLYGHEVRGPLALLREIWEGDKGSVGSVNVVSYVVQMRERLEKMGELAQSHMEEAQHQQKTWYDKSARQRSFDPGQKVLVLLPSNDNKLLAKWQGPVEVLRKLGPTTYQVSTPRQPRSSKVLHINLLKEWVQRPEKTAEVMLIRSVLEEEEVNEQYLPPSSDPVDHDLSHLSEDEQLQVRSICKSEVFQETPGRTNLVEHTIVVKEDASVRRLSYRIPERLLVALKKEVDLMLSLGIIEASKSEWCNPVVLVPKKDGSIRFCIDFRYLNSISLFDSYPTPRIDDLLERLGKAKYLTTLDLCKGYWQVPLTEQSRKLTAFRTPWGLFQFTVLPFGLHGAPATFQRLMDQVLSDFSGFAAAYLDDIVIYSNTWEEHLEHLQAVMDRIHSAGLTVNPSKCVFAAAETEYLGHIIGNGVIRPQVSKIQAMESCPLPQTRKQLRSFLGMAGFYHRFIPQFSTRAALLTDLTGSRSPNQIQWTEEAVAAFQDLQKSLRVWELC